MELGGKKFTLTVASYPGMSQMLRKIRKFDKSQLTGLACQVGAGAWVQVRPAQRSENLHSLRM